MRGSRITKFFFMGVFAGGLFGAAAALLYAPKSGRRLRKDIAKKKDKILKDTENYIADTKKRASEIIKESKKKADSILDDAKKKMANIGNKSADLIEEEKEKILKETNVFKNAFKAGTDTFNEERKTIIH